MVVSSLAGAPWRTMTVTEYVQTSCGILPLIEYVQLTIPAGAFNRICPAGEGWDILLFGVCPVPLRSGALYRLWVEYVQLHVSWGILSVGSVQFCWGTLPRHGRNRICPEVLGHSDYIEYVQLTIVAGTINNICSASEGWRILQFRECPVPPMAGAL